MIRCSRLLLAIALVCVAGCNKKDPPECGEARGAIAGALTAGRKATDAALEAKSPDAWQTLAQGHRDAAFKLTKIQSSKPAIASAIAKLATVHEQMASLATKAEGKATLDEIRALNKSTGLPAEKELQQACQAAAE